MCRLYGLLHDVGHLPFSHLFETALSDVAAERFSAEDPKARLEKLTAEWFGESDFKKPHEAFGRLVAQSVLTDARNLRDNVRNAVLELIGKKHLPDGDTLQPVKLMIDSEVDVDRIDSTARDGKLAGGEYGSYDIERLCSGVRCLRQDGERGQNKWTLAYSRKALSSLEGLLLDRYRTHTWIHFHHRVVAMKCAMRILIARLIREQETGIRRGLVEDDCHSLCVTAQMFDDVWLLSTLRQKEQEWKDEPEASALAAILHRKNDGVNLLWKDRLDWTKAWKSVQAMATTRLGDEVDFEELGRNYEVYIDGAFREQHSWSHLRMRVFCLPFKPLDDRKLPLLDATAEDAGLDLRDYSALCRSLETAWQAEPQLYVVVFGDLRYDTAKERSKALEAIRHWWETNTAEWLSKLRS